jgi:hypothetical protein
MGIFYHGTDAREVAKFLAWVSVRDAVLRVAPATEVAATAGMVEGCVGRKKLGRDGAKRGRRLCRRKADA